MKLPQLVFRELLQAAKTLDASPALRALISTQMLVRPVVGAQKTRLPHVDAFNQFLLEYLENRLFYVPSRSRKDAQTIVREKFQRVPCVPHGLDASLVTLKALSDRLAYAMELGVVEDMTRAIQRKVKKSKVTPRNEALREAVQMADRLRAGVFLLAHPLLHGMFGRSVIVLTEHDRSGTKGFIVNQPTKTPLEKAFKVHPDILRIFGVTTNVRCGGPVQSEFAEVLHMHEEFGGEPVRAAALMTSASPERLFVGADLAAAAKAIANNHAMPHDIVFFNGLSTWEAGQLESEVHRGTWVPVQAPLSAAIDAKRGLWRELMGGLGGEYDAFSRMPAIHHEQAHDSEDEEDDDDDDDDDEDMDDDAEGSVNQLK